jgi:prohibitin 1
MVSLTLRVMSRPDVSHLSQIYRSLGLDYDERVLPSIGNEVLKATVAQVRGLTFSSPWIDLDWRYSLTPPNSSHNVKSYVNRRSVFYRALAQTCIKVSSRIREDLLKRAREFNIVLEDVSIVRLLVLYLA